MARDIDNVEIGDVQVFADGTDIGHTLGGATFTFEKEFAELKVDQYSSPVDYALSGEKLMIKVTLAEPTIENLGRGISQGEFNSGSLADKLEVGRDTGYLLSQDAVALRLHPRAKADTDFTKDIYIWRAIVKENIELSYTVEDQRVLELTFEALPDESQPNGARLGRVGPATIS
jgi:hypothetical protein